MIDPAVPPGLWERLVCPCCRSPLQRRGEGAECARCRVVYLQGVGGQLDLRLRGVREHSHTFVLSDAPPAPVRVGPLAPCPAPEVDFSGLERVVPFAPELMSYFPRAPRPGSLALDLGCGDAVHRPAVERAGFGYVGLDMSDPAAPLQADAHALPFCDGAFDFMISRAVLEHLRQPVVAMDEAFRVLVPGSLFLGAVAFQEPFHGDSYYHHSHLGAVATLQAAGFEVQHVGPVRGWPVLKAQAIMGLFPELPDALSSALVFPLHMLHRLWWRAGRIVNPKATELARTLTTAGAVFFIARKAV